MGLQNRSQLLTIVAGLALIVGLALLIAGVVKNAGKCESGGSSGGQKGEPTAPPKTTALPKETDSQKLFSMLTEVKETYYKIYPYQAIYDPDQNPADLLQKYKPYDPAPASIKERTDKSKELRKKIDDLGIERSKLRPREKKALAQMEHYLDSVFGNPYEENYYAGDWMMGPNYFCWQPICDMVSNLRSSFNTGKAYVPTTRADVVSIVEVIRAHKPSIEQYQKNVQAGVEAGMVRAKEDCEAGFNALNSKYRNRGADIVKSFNVSSKTAYFISEKYYSKLSVGDRSNWGPGANLSVEMFVANELVESIGKPLDALLSYLKEEYRRHCVPSTVTSGLGNLPIDNVWKDMKQTNKTTTKKLPNGDALNGAAAYEMILPYFTTDKTYTAKYINELGIRMRGVLYPRAVEIAKKITKKAEQAAVQQFKEDLNSHEMFFNTTVIPENENGAAAAEKCKSMETAKVHCPVRYEAMILWFKEVQSILALIEPKTVNFFYLSGKNASTPNCPLKMQAKFNPSSGSQSFSSSGYACTKPARYQLPFFLKRPGPRYNAYSVAGHEARPGHHTQVQGFDEHFSGGEKTDKDVIDWLNKVTYYTAFTEGWALYAENPLLATETDLYDELPLQEYGMLKWQIWRALRLIIDTGLHSRNMSMQEALDLFEEFAWDTTDKSYKDTIRYMSDPGQATGYMLGQLAIWNMRNKTEEEFKKAGVQFDEKEFHFQILSTGKSPLAYLAEHIDSYIVCKVNAKARADCAEILDPKGTHVTSKGFMGKTVGTPERWDWIMRNQKEVEHHE